MYSSPSISSFSVAVFAYSPVVSVRASIVTPTWGLRECAALQTSAPWRCSGSLLPQWFLDVRISFCSYALAQTAPYKCSAPCFCCCSNFCLLVLMLLFHRLSDSAQIRTMFTVMFRTLVGAFCHQLASNSKSSSLHRVSRYTRILLATVQGYPAAVWVGTKPGAPVRVKNCLVICTR